MAKEGIGGIFGKPKPARGKPTKASDRLEEDAQGMETRLRQLQISMMEEKQKRDAELPLKHAGNRWRSAREDRGSVSQYARDVQQKMKDQKPRKAKKKDLSQQMEQGRASSSGGTMGRKKKAKKSSSRPELAILSPATIAKWTVPQVLEWLMAIGLEDCQSGFEFHQVTGKALLELTPDGCARVGISKLSARNRLLAELEIIRDQQSKQTRCEGTGQAKPAAIIDPKLRDGQIGPEMPSPVSKLAAKTHWSHVAPLAETSISSGDGQVPVNLADGDFDEEASHASFMKALLEWRDIDADQAVNGSNQEDEWVNPTMTAFHAADADKDDADGPSHGGALLKGSYDEAEARESFLQALQAWRSGSNAEPGTDHRAATPSVEQTETGCVAIERKSCWQCYHVMQVDHLVYDEQTKKSFCGASCQAAYQEEYARFYAA
ncbi:hypothetical protein BBJ28_00004798 [Nothophytophthora sp. Chile5]|nr:hypothetical protein BBJ28_00004798 [Nothophytophthora sp. Chile5]